jgi:hypothetical protein
VYRFVQSTFGGSSIRKILAGRFVLLGLGTPDHVLFLQFLKGDELVLIDELARCLLLKVLALVAYFAVTFRNPCNRPSASMTPTLFAGKRLLCRCELLFGLTVVAGLLYEGAIGERGKVRNAQVDAHIDVREGQGTGGNLAGEDDVPVLALAFERARFDGSLDLTMQLHLDRAQAGDRQTIARKFPACVIGKAKAKEDSFLLSYRGNITQKKGYTTKRDFLANTTHALPLPLKQRGLRRAKAHCYQIGLLEKSLCNMRHNTELVKNSEYRQ